ncbi:response regulator [Roseobacter sp. A03A-229]
MNEQKCKIVIVDDSDTDIFVTKRVLRRNPKVGEIIGVHSGNEMLDMARTSSLPVADYVLLDISMPFMSGFTLLEMLTEHYGADVVTSKIAFLTSSEDPADKVKAESFRQASHYFQKPLSEDDTQALLVA